MGENETIAQRTGVSVALVEKILAAHLDLLFALGLAHPDDENRGAAMRNKYPDLLRPSVVNGAGGRDKPVTWQLEATVVQLESGATARAVVDVLAAYHEVNELIDAQHTASYRQWAKGWCGN